jgi:hypothetical protein
MVEYRGYHLMVQRHGPGWKVIIKPPVGRLVFTDVPNTRDPEGRSTVLNEARALVDRDIAEGENSN